MQTAEVFKKLFGLDWFKESVHIFNPVFARRKISHIDPSSFFAFWSFVFASIFFSIVWSTRFLIMHQRCTGERVCHFSCHHVCSDRPLNFFLYRTRSLLTSSTSSSTSLSTSPSSSATSIELFFSIGLTNSCTVTQFSSCAIFICLDSLFLDTIKCRHPNYILLWTFYLLSLVSNLYARVHDSEVVKLES